MTTAHIPAIGQEVETADGKRLGSVKRIDPAAFLIDVAGQPDYWIRLDDITSIQANHVRLAFTSEALPEHQIRYGDII